MKVIWPTGKDSALVRMPVELVLVLPNLSDWSAAINRFTLGKSRF